MCAGAFGSIYQARNITGNHPDVAVKVVKKARLSADSTASLTLARHYCGMRSISGKNRIFVMTFSLLGSHQEATMEYVKSVI